MAFDPFSAIIGGGFDLLGGYLQDKRANKAFDKQQKLDAAGARRAYSALQYGTGLEEALIKSGTKERLKGFKGARGALDLGGVVAKQGLQQRGKQNLANTEQSLVSRGLIGTSTGAQQFAGIGDTTSAQLAGVDAALAQSFAELGMQEAGVRAQGQQQLAQLLSEKTEAMFNLSQVADPFNMPAKKKKKKKHGLIKGVYDIGDLAQTFS